MLDIFDHVLEAYDFWFVQVLGVERGGFFPDVDGAKTMEGVTRHEKATGDAVLNYTESLTETDLDWEVRLSEADLPARLGDICWHVVEEELQHRGELNALMWQMDVEPPIGTYEQWLKAKTAIQ